MDAPFQRFDPVAMHNAVKTGERALAVKAPAAIQHRKMLAKHLEASGVSAPFVEITRQDGRTVLLFLPRKIGDHVGLLCAPKAG